MELSLSVSTTLGLTWPIWKQLVSAADELGFAGIYGADHVISAGSSLDAIVASGYAAAHTQRIRFGTLVAPVSYRDPVVLTRQAINLDHLSEGRMVLGLGTGWLEVEHTMYGFPLGNPATRVDRLEEALHVVTSLLRSNEPVSYSGRFYRLEKATLLPRPLGPHTPKLLIGGTGRRRMLPLIARYADVWNADKVSLKEFRVASSLLDEHMRKVGRSPEEIKRSVLVPVLCGRNQAEIEGQLQAFRFIRPDLPTHPWEAVLEELRRAMPTLIIGTPEEVVAGLQAYADAGVDEFMIHYRGLDDVDGLRRLAEEVMPHLAANERNPSVNQATTGTTNNDDSGME
jgi:alkanesulfonate monooxygenase SsuD/methylene tetrahydromethanopterin reductase-like flavin-dependent oxidoreductase (luciferase family)